MQNILLITSIFGFVLTSVIFLKKTNNSKATFFLGSFYLILSFYALQSYIVDGGMLYKFPRLFLWPLIIYNLLPVPIYLYFRTILDQQFKWNLKYLLLFVPSLLSVIDVVYIYMQPVELYAEMFNNAATDPENRLNADYLILSLNQHFFMRHFWQFSVLVLLLPKLLNYVEDGRNDNLKKTLNSWLICFWAILLLMSVAAILYGFEKMFDAQILNQLLNLKQGSAYITLLLYLMVFAVGILPIYFSNILNGYPEVKTNFQNTNKVFNTSSELKFGLEKPLIEKMLAVLKKRQLYLEQDFNVTYCARELEIPTHHLSYFLKHHYGLSFSEYRNNLRMEYAKNLIENDFLDMNTIEALAGECGFASRSSFSKVFKYATGVNPSEYAINMRKDN